MKFDMELRGARGLSARFRRAARSARSEMKDVERAVLEDDVYPMTQEQVPEDTGALASTGKVVEQEGAWSIVYGGAASAGHGGDVDYAVIQHERLDYAHRKGKAKFVEDPMMQAAGDMDRLMADRIDEHDLLGGA